MFEKKHFRNLDDPLKSLNQLNQLSHWLLTLCMILQPSAQQEHTCQVLVVSTVPLVLSLDHQVTERAASVAQLEPPISRRDQPPASVCHHKYYLLCRTVWRPPYKTDIIGALNIQWQSFSFQPTNWNNYFSVNDCTRIIINLIITWLCM